MKIGIIAHIKPEIADKMDELSSKGIVVGEKQNSREEVHLYRKPPFSPHS